MGEDLGRAPLGLRAGVVVHDVERPRSAGLDRRALGVERRRGGPESCHGTVHRAGRGPSRQCGTRADVSRRPGGDRSRSSRRARSGPQATPRDRRIGIGSVPAAAVRRPRTASRRPSSRRLSSSAGNRPGVQVALAAGAAEPAQDGDLLGSLDALGDDLEVEGAAELDDRPGQHGPVAALADPVDERLVDLEDVDREPLEVAERRVARPEVVDRQADPDPAQVGQLADRLRSVVCMRTDSVISRIEARRIEAARRRAPCRPRRRGPGAGTGAPTGSPRPTARRARSRRQRLRVAAGLRSRTHRPISTMSPDSSARPMKSAGHEQAAPGRLPADQGLEPDDRRRRPGRRWAGSGAGARRDPPRRAAAPRAPPAR